MSMYEALCRYWTNAPWADNQQTERPGMMYCEVWMEITIYSMWQGKFQNYITNNYKL